MLDARCSMLDAAKRYVIPPMLTSPGVEAREIFPQITQIHADIRPF